MYIILRKHINMEPRYICFEAKVVREQSCIINNSLSGFFSRKSYNCKVASLTEDVSGKIRSTLFSDQFTTIATDSSLGMIAGIAYLVILKKLGRET